MSTGADGRGRVTVVVVEDDPGQREQLAGFVESLGFAVATAGDVPTAREILDAGGVDLVLSDLRLPGESGVDLLRWASVRHPLADFVMVTAHGSLETAVEAMRLGAEDFLTKPINLDVLEQRLRRVVERRNLAREVRELRDRLEERVGAAGIVAESGAMQKVLALSRRVAPTESSVLITGESGTGKEVVADLVQGWSSRRHGPFLRINCGALPETLLESELFGHTRGAFTGADRERAGLFREAGGGTLLLDEIGEVSPAVQVKLLRVLQEKEIRPVGDERTHSVDVRVLAATNRDLEADVREGRFRQDLLFRLNVFEVHVPPLRERPEDVAALIPLLVRRYAEETLVPVPRVGREAHDLLMAYPFPGNVRELQNILHRAVILADAGIIGAGDLPRGVRSPDSGADDVPVADAGRTLPELVAEIERRSIRRALAEHGGVRARAARSLGLPERVLRYKLKRYGIDPTFSSGSRQERREGGSGRA